MILMWNKKEMWHFAWYGYGYAATDFENTQVVAHVVDSIFVCSTIDGRRSEKLTHRKMKRILSNAVKKIAKKGVLAKIICFFS